MAWAQEMKNLAANIKTSHRDRTRDIGNLKRYTDDLIAKFHTELREMARNLREFLSKSEEARKKDFNAIMTETRARIREIKGYVKDFIAKSEEIRKKEFATTMGNVKGEVRKIKGYTADLLAQYDKELKELAADLKEFLGKSEASRMADFKAMMQDINSDIDDIRKNIKSLLGDYRGERKEAARYWAGLGSRVVIEEAPVEETPTEEKEEEEAEAPAPKAKAAKPKARKKSKKK